MSDNEKTLTTINDFAIMEEINPNTIWLWIKKGLLKAEKHMINSKWCYLFDINDALSLAAALKSNQRWKPYTAMDRDLAKKRYKQYYNKNKSNIIAQHNEYAHRTNYRKKRYAQYNEEKLQDRMLTMVDKLRNDFSEIVNSIDNLDDLCALERLVDVLMYIEKRR